MGLYGFIFKVYFRDACFPGPGHPSFWTHVFWTWPDSLLDLGAQKIGGLACVFSGPCGGMFLDLHVFALYPGKAKLLVSDLGLFLDPCTCIVDLASIGWGGNSIVIGAHIGLDVFGPWRLLFLNLYIFLDLAQGGRNFDIETRCMQEVVDAGEVRILKQKNVRSGGEANGGSLRMKRNGCRKLRGT